MPRNFILSLCVCLTAAGCCGSKYCAPHRAAETFDRLFVSQVRQGVHDTGGNLVTIGNFVAHDVSTAGTRLGATTALVYRSASFANAATNLPYVPKLVIRQARDGITETPNNLRLIGKCLCLCSD